LLFLSCLWLQLCSRLFPYTTLFRSPLARRSRRLPAAAARVFVNASRLPFPCRRDRLLHLSYHLRHGRGGPVARRPRAVCQQLVRSEEHTSELQSHLNLVCRLLLEKK